MVGSAKLMDVEQLVSQMDDKNGAGAQLVRRAYERALEAHAGQARASGESYIQHPLAVASILADLRLDPATIAAALLHDVVEDTSITIDDLRQEFGEEIARLVDGVTKLENINQLRKMSRPDLEEEQAENLRKIFLAMVDDVRVVLIKLADRLHNMRTLGALPDHKRRRIARETLEIYAPLANRLGIWQIKWELEDLAFRYLEPATYKRIASLIDERREDRMHTLEQITEVLRQRLKEAGIEAEVSSRPKHIYSIYRKMQRKGVEFDQIYDVRAVRIIVNTIAECYAALGIVHSLWKPIPREFDDFIATPKDNMYRSLHTAVVGPDGKPLEVQIRTWEMHRTAEYGIAAHWRYKEQLTKRDVDFENKIAWLRQIMEWRKEVTDAREFVDSLKTDVFQDRVYVFTPQGDVIDLPAGATPVDFAYHVHTEIGHRCRGARVNGRIVSLDYQLQNGDQVEIITAKRGGPSRDWLNPQLNYVKTSRARGKIRQWFRRQDREQNIQLGREILERELKRLNAEDISLEELAMNFGYEKVDEFLAAIV
ncbi:MAG: RelA/SpoT family protein [Anaerolineae bacterium]